MNTYLISDNQASSDDQGKRDRHRRLLQLDHLSRSDGSQTPVARLIWVGRMKSRLRINGALGLDAFSTRCKLLTGLLGRKVEST